MRIDWSRSAREDLQSLQAYIAKDSPYFARQFTHRIIAAVARLSEFPEIGRQVRESKSTNVREIFFRDYRIIYELKLPERIVILAVMHGRRDLTRKELQPWKSD